ncbi:gamma-glutamyltransferase family protein [Thioalkalivibrio sp. HK1]|uniref:gamma-glutamyltransferase family protein n=1 Tax=Thioalkalivibrio sp. HK1 TaxID=1469245 RepID=UPI00047051B5|nr:gamma-glutamyltransferase family protein [Thioalkalivibrio sp. HK1]
MNHESERLPGPRSGRSMALASNGMVATSQALAAQAGLGILQAGGNAVDAAIATAIALTVVEPTSNGIGSDAFAIVHDGRGIHGINGSGPAPRRLSAESLREAGATTFPERGWTSVSIPGAPDTWRMLHERFGSAPFDSLFAPAIRLAEEGFPVSPVIARLWHDARALFEGKGDPAFAEWERIFLPDGRSPVAGEIWRSPDHARTLRRLASQGVRDFYEGEIAQRIAEHARSSGAMLDESDLSGFHCEWVEPISIAYRDHEIWEIPPNGQGIAALQALGIVAGTPMHTSPPGSEACWHYQIEAMKLAFADAYRHVADPHFSKVPVQGLLDPSYLARRRDRITERAGDHGPGMPPSGGTVYLCAADRAGMMVSLIQSNYLGFGSGVVIPQTGISLQNRAACFSLEAGHPNEAAGGKRPRHTIIPGFLTRGGEAVGPFGVMGGEMQPQGHLQVISAMIDHGLDPQAALDSRRWRIAEGDRVMVEAQTDPRVIEGLEKRGHRVEVEDHSLDFGRGQIIRRLASGALAGGTEPRADGTVAAW